MMALPGPLELPWAEVVSVHCVGSYWAPGFSNYLLLFQVRSNIGLKCSYLHSYTLELYSSYGWV